MVSNVDQCLGDVSLKRTSGLHPLFSRMKSTLEIFVKLHVEIDTAFCGEKANCYHRGCCSVTNLSQTVD